MTARMVWQTLTDVDFHKLRQIIPRVSLSLTTRKKTRCTTITTIHSRNFNIFVLNELEIIAM